jgi:hypothetical protein
MGMRPGVKYMAPKQVSIKLYTYDVVFEAQFGGKFYKESDESAQKHPGKRYWLKKKEGEWWVCKEEPTEWKRKITLEEIQLLLK